MQEAEYLIYPTALTKVTQLAVLPNETDRTISKKDFVSSIDSSAVLFSHWFLREQEAQKYSRFMRRQFFTSTNIEPYARFFIIELPKNIQVTDVVLLLYAIRHKWSSHDIKWKPDSERYAPYIWMRDADTQMLVTIKSQLLADGVGFCDGHSFQHAPFNPASIAKPQTRGNKISIRVLDSKDKLESTLNHISKTKIVYQFFLSKPSQLDWEGKHIQIPIHTPKQIIDII